MATAERWNDTELATRQGPFSLRVEHRPGELYAIELYGELDLAGATLASEHLERATASDAREVVIDLAGLDFIDSAGLGVLVRANAEGRGSARLRFLRPSGAVARVITLTGLDQVLPFTD